MIALARPIPYRVLPLVQKAEGAGPGRESRAGPALATPAARSGTTSSDRGIGARPPRAGQTPPGDPVAATGLGVKGSAFCSVTLIVLPLGVSYVRVSPTLAPSSALPSGEAAE